MAEKLGEGRRNSDRRKSGVARRVRHTTGHDNNMTGDGRRNEYARGIEKTSSGSRSIPIAETLGGDLQRRQNGAGRRAAPQSFLKAGGSE